MPRKVENKSRVKTPAEALRVVAQGLRVAAVRPSIGGYQPHEKQIAFHSSEATIRALFGGNRSGKTVGGATESVWRATGKHPFQRVKPAPTTGRIVAVDFLNGVDKIVKPEIARWLPPSELINGSWEDSYDKAHNVLTLDNRSTIEFMSYAQDTDAFAGTSRDWFWMDEEGPREIYTENLLRIGDCGGVGWLTMTPLEGMTWVFDDIYEAAQTARHIDVFVVDMEDNPFLNQGDMDVILSGLTEDEKEARKHGKFVQIGGLIYKCLGPQNVLDSFVPPPDWLHVAGMDSGIANPTAWLWTAVNKDGLMVVYDEYYQAGQVTSFHAAKVHERNALHGREPDYYVGDPSIKNTDPITGTSILIEYVKHGIPIVLGNNDVKAGIDLVTTKLIGVGVPPSNTPFLYITENCPVTLKEMRR
ncbi:MAG: terminase large subunit domain-containing protein, partial [Actinomycetota bacterium]